MAAGSPTASALRILFPRASEGGTVCLAKFPEPFARAAMGEPIRLDEVLSGPPAPRAESLIFVFVPTGGDFSVYESWLRQEGSDGETGVIVDLSLADRILWRPGRAVMLGSSERQQETAAALAVFAFFEAQLRDLESGIRQRWIRAHQDMDLTTQITRKSLAEWPRVAEITKWATASRMKFAALDTSLDLPADSLTPRARRVVGELANMTRIRDRLRGVDDQLEVFEDLYELANDRLSEFSHYQGEYRLEVWIVLILVAEVLLMVGELVALARK